MNNEIANVNPFEVAPSENHDLMAVNQSRSMSEMQAQVFLAKQFPRNDAEVYSKSLKACGRPGLAEKAIYSFPRSGKTVQGPSVVLVRELARIAGNITYGVRLVGVDDHYIHIAGFAHDFETNAKVEEEVKIPKKVLRKGNVYVDTEDERDLRELKNKHGAIAVRNCLLQILPADVVEDAMAKCRETMRKAAAGELEQSKEQTVRRLVVAFGQAGVDQKMLEEFLGYPIERVDEKALSEFRQILTSIRDGNSTREDYFNVAGSRGAAGKSDLNEVIGDGGKGKGRNSKGRDSAAGSAKAEGE